MFFGLCRFCGKLSFLMVGAVIALVLAGTCNSRSGADEWNGFNGPRVNKQIDERLIVLGERIGPLRLSGMIEDALKLFGRAETRESAIFPPSLLYTWGSLGLAIIADKETGNILWISIDEKASWAAGFATADGIRLGMGGQQILDVLGAPDRKITAEGATSLYYDRRGVRFTFPENGPRAGIIASLRVVWPTIPRGDTVIIPGRRISSVETEAPISQVLEVLGGGYAKIQRQGLSNYRWPHLGLILVEQGGRVTVIRAGENHPGDAANIRYTTVEGLGVGNTYADFISAYGEPSDTERGRGGLSWQIYRSRGIAVAFDANSVARAVDVFPPELTSAYRPSPLLLGSQLAEAQEARDCKVFDVC